MLSKITGFALNGLEGVPVEVETDIFRGMKGERSFYADAERQSADSETFSYSAVLFSDYDAFEILVCYPK